MSTLREAAVQVVEARRNPKGSWEELNEAIGALEDVLNALNAGGAIQAVPGAGMPSHSPGPFALMDGNCGVIIGILDANGAAVAILGRRDALKQENINLFLGSPELLASLQEYGLSYTDDQLEQLAETTSGLGEIGPQAAQREIRRRAAITKATGKGSA